MGTDRETKTQNEDVVNQDIMDGSKKEKKKKQKKAAIGTEDEDAAATAASTLLNEGNSSNKKKSHRSRKKHQFNAIRAQMEFYFGDSNLSKDRFLKQLIDKDPFVPLEVFLTFNKLKTLTGSVDEIAKSLANSKLLELDETQQKVRRKTALPLPVERNVDEKTLYVEALPPSADHDWVRQTFERFGAVTYVSLPKYAKSRKIKEFGFVEFEQESSVEKAVKAFREFNGVLCMVDADPSELTSVKSYIKEQNIEDDVKSEATDAKTNKRKTENEAAAVAAVGGEPKAKKVKTEEDVVGSSTVTAAVVDEDDTTASETAEETDAGDDANQLQEGDATAAVTKKKNRKKKKKSKSNEQRQKDTELNLDASYYELKVLPKRDWKRLRNKYLNLQREKTAALKRKAWKEQQQAQQQAAKENDGGAETLDIAPSPAKKSKPTNERKLQHRMNMNFYGAGGAEDEAQTTKSAAAAVVVKALERAPLFSYESGIIVEVGFIEPCVNVKEFKTDMRQYAKVKYVDVKEGAMHAHLRLETAAAAGEFVEQVSCAEYKCKILAGEPESEYWKKIELDREMKLNKQVKVPQKRGREKVKELVAKQLHIRFGDDDDAE